MRKNSRRYVVLEVARNRLEVGIRPTFRELGDATGMSAVGAWKHVQKLVGEGKLVLTEEGYGLPEVSDLRAIPSDTLRGELARRGETLDALAEPRLLRGQGRHCAANGCKELVGRGKLMCREHWFGVQPRTRSAIFNAFRARDVQAYQDAVEAARDQLGGFTRVVERVG